MIKIELTEENVKALHIYHERFKDVWETATPKGISRVQESHELDAALSAICQQAQEQGVKLE